ncbi:hypothetical protein AMATHDRAFT_74488 [Amanita thiersii Skay4041]|uniref:SH3 domain-containing protein n=1 Tax=Amanita thiersii Skay4041 TaxID=703135 RepID=A0A2A9NLW7_9AGAR|nr:hypothetical protein AMATHDRAFT_74488 [Amanita thiersii Skay4041]
MGVVGIAGAFTGFDFFANSSSVYDPSTASLVSRSSTQGSLTYLASTNSGGSISSSCTLNGVVYVAGFFSSINNVQVSNVVSYSPSTNSFSPVGNTQDAPNGPVDVIYCDIKGNKLWLGGDFSSPGLAVAVYDIKSKTWSRPPFTGLSGAQGRVLSIIQNPSDTGILFAGSFVTKFQGNESSLPNGQNNPNIPFSQGATPFSSSLVPIPLQGAQVLGSPSSTLQGFDDIHNILCPTSNDSPGNTWFAEVGSPALVTIRTFSFISAGGLRLGNTFQTDHGTKEFSVTTIPDNKVQTLHYVDPVTGDTSTCSSTCPLSTDPSILYQDFLFDNALSITGVQIRISAFVGSSPGLHILQLLSSGAFASAIDQMNNQSCYAPNPSNVSLVGNWEARVANTDIAGTTQRVLIATTNVDTPSSSGPSVTWMPYVSASGNYDINLLVPGCLDFQDCGQRTSVKITVFPGGGLPPSVTSVSQNNQQDMSYLIYSGPVYPSSPSFVATITMMLDDHSTTVGEGGKVDVVADRVQLVLKSVNGSTSASGNTDPSAEQNLSRIGFGFFEWPMATTDVLDATNILPNTTQTPLDSIALALYSGIGGTNGGLSTISINAMVHYGSGAILLGGAFSISSGTASGSANILLYQDGSLKALPERGLNGPVSSIVVYGGLAFVGGSFNDTSSGSSQGQISGVGLFDIEQNQWLPLGGGLNGPVSSLELAGGQLLVAGNFSQVSVGSNAKSDAIGFAVWDIRKSKWVNSGGYLNAQLSLVTNATSSIQVLAGSITSLQRYGASGMVLLKNGHNKDEPVVTPLGSQFAEDLAGPTLSTNNQSRSIHISRRTLWGRVSHSPPIFARQSTPSLGNLVPLPVFPPANAPALLAGGFWKNSSSGRELVVLGGNFSFVSNASNIFEAVALYDSNSQDIYGLVGNQINGTVRALLVNNDKLFVGGDFMISNTSSNGFAVYDLSLMKWTGGNIQPLQGESGRRVVVRSISKSRSRDNLIIVAGSFVSLGTVRCTGICALDLTTFQWSTLGGGFTGEVASVAYAGAKQESLIAAGSISLPSGSTSVARFDFLNSTWVTLGTSNDFPGPATAVEVNNGNSSSIFVAGRSSDNTVSFLSFWNGSKWTLIDSRLENSSAVLQLTMVPLQDTHAATGIIEPDRMLMISGALNNPSFGNITSALFDGQSVIPYITTSTSGPSSYVASLFHSFANFSFVQRHFLATGVVILISIAIAAGVVFLLALIGILWTLFSRRDDKLGKFEAVNDDDDSSLQYRPSSLLEHINAATRTTILGTSPYSNYNYEKEEGKPMRDGLDNDVYLADASNYVRAETPSDAMGGLAPEETSRPAHARYSFDGTGEGELAISAGTELEVLDDRDPSWWYARDVNTGKEGVVPAAYLY